MSLVEIMIAVSILTVGVMAFLSTFQYITKAIHVSRARTLATNLVQEKIENLRNVPYAKLMITTQAVVWSQFEPPIGVDAVNYPPETIHIGGVDFMRGVWISFAQVQDNSIGGVSLDYPDTGLKLVTVDVGWKEGNVWKHVESDNLYENPNVNPLSASRIGAVWENNTLGPAVPGAQVRVVEHPDWADFAGINGSYLIQAQPGNYTLKASSPGYQDTIIANVDLSSAGAPGKTNFVMTRIATGSVSGNVWLNTGLVISQVTGSTHTILGGRDPGLVNTEYVELFNPTTYTIYLKQGANQMFKLNVIDSGGTIHPDVALDFNQDHVDPGKYFLIGSSGSFYINGQVVFADAMYHSPNHSYISGTGRGCVQLTASDGTMIDQVGWDGSTGFMWEPAPCKEGNAIPVDGWGVWTGRCPSGIGTGNQIVRVSSPGLTSDAYGHAYDSGDNRSDFLYPMVVCPGRTIDSDANSTNHYFDFTPHYSTQGSYPVIAGKPAVQAGIAADDTIGASTLTYTAYVTSGALQLPYSAFKLDDVATGNWTVIAASRAPNGAYQWKTPSVTVTANHTTAIPNTRAGVPGAGQVSLDTGTLTGYMGGGITEPNGANICVAVQAGGGSCSCTGGMYFCYDISTGPIVAVFNPNGADGVHVEYDSPQTIQTGEVNMVSVQLPQGGTLKGFVTPDGSAALPNITVAATQSGLVRGTGVSDSSGYFYIKNLAAGAYNVAPVLDPLMASDPPSKTGSPTVGTTTDIGTFIVSGASGKLTGHIYRSTGTVTTPVTTGALIIVSTANVGSPPPAISAVNSGAQAVYYMASSLADGSYTVEVRGSQTPLVFSVMAYLPIVSGADVTIKTAALPSKLTIQPSQVVTQDIIIP